jgi:EAL domain-containing protein (putative c-di-GMP-specific phosphodiesterase class I)/CheY-like chemotaxis protein
MNCCRVLIVEDHPFQRHCLLGQLKQIPGVTVDTAQDGRIALGLLQQNRYDLLLSDLMMPDMDGVQLIQELAELEHKPALALMSTLPKRLLACAGEVARLAGFSVVARLCKPLGLSALRDIVDKLPEPPCSLTTTCHDAPAPDRASVAMALHNGQLQAWFQPKKCLRRRRIVAAEALVRWQHPERGILMPADFLPALVDLGLEEGLLGLVIGQTVEAQVKWREQGHCVPVSINLPTHLLDHNDLADRLLQRVLEGGGEPQDIGFELMEDSTTRHEGNYYANACRLRFKGFGLAQDDFGSGYSSYFNLASTPFSELKIDRSLVHGCLDNPSLASTVDSIVRLGRQLGLTVVAEGVETAQELAFLREVNCHQVQGFLISPAVPWYQFQALLGAQSRLN